MFPELKMKLKGCYFDNIVDIQMESQVVLNNLIEMDFQGALQQGREHWGQCIHAQRKYFKGDGGL